MIDDVSTDGTCEEVKRIFPEIRIIRNERERFVAGCRNIGVKNAAGRYFLLIDDDNVIDENCVSHLVEILESKFNPTVGVVAPIMYYLRQPDRVWCAGIERSMITSITRFIGRDKLDRGQFNELIYSKDFPNVFMIKKEVVDRIGLFDENNFPIHYDEADFCERARRSGYKIVCYPEAKIWHDIPLPEEEKEKSRLFHVPNEFRAYYAGRNRIVFHRKYSKWWQFMLFLVFNCAITLYYLKVIFFGSRKKPTERLKVAEAYLRGVMSAAKSC